VSVTPEVKAEIVAQFERNRQRFSPFRTSTALGIQVKDVLEVIAELKEPQARALERNGGYGREELRPFLVARRTAMTSGWDNTQPEIRKARENYELGTHDMATGRDGPWLLLYSFPVVFPEPRPNYFNTEKYA
jgi:hypothetical protein